MLSGGGALRGGASALASANRTRDRGERGGRLLDVVRHDRDLYFSGHEEVVGFQHDNFVHDFFASEAPPRGVEADNACIWRRRLRPLLG